MMFRTYGIEDGDAIIALPDDGEKARRDRPWISGARESYLNQLLTHTEGLEAAHNQDRHWLALERYPKSYSKVCRFLLGMSRPWKNESKTVIPEVAEGPSVEPLPVCWS
jgi:hypothetical protein